MRHPVTLSVGSVGAGMLLLFGAVACSSFTTAPLASADAAPADASGVAVVDSGPDASSVDPAVLAAALAPSRVHDCAEWAKDAHSARFSLVAGQGTDPDACRLCRVAGATPDNTPFVQLSLPALPGSYTISAMGRQVGGVPLEWGVGFRRGGTSAGATSDPSTPNFSSLTRDSIPADASTQPTYAVLEIDDDGQCVDIADIEISYPAK